MNTPDIQLEKAITHMLVTDESYLVSFAPLLDERMFLEPVNAAFVKSAHELVNENRLTKLNLLERVESKGFKSASKTYTEQAAAITSSGNFEKHYLGWIEHAKLHFIKSCDEELLTKNPTSAELIKFRTETLEQARVLGIPNEGVSLTQALAGGVEWLKKMKALEGKTLVTTGYEELDTNIIGLLPGTLTSICAEPSAGKTTLACELALRAEALQSGPVIFNSLEMLASRVAMKITASVNEDNSMEYERSFQKAQPEFENVLARLIPKRDLSIRFFEMTDPNALESSIIQLKPSLVIWDYLQIVPTPARYAGRRHEFIGELARNLQQIAKRRQVPVVILCQLNRDGKGGNADMSNIKDSATIEEASDNVLFLERPNLGESGIDGLKALLSLKKARSGIVDGKLIELMMNPLAGKFRRWNPLVAAQLLDSLETASK